MDNYVEGLVLAYFRQFGREYSLYDLKDKIGISMGLLNEILDELFQKGFLEYRDNLIGLTISGRIALSNSELEGYLFDEENYLDKEEIIKWPLDKVYVVHSFSKKKWRGSGE